MIFIMATKDHFPVFFTDSEIMQKAVADLAYLLAATLLLNSVQPVISGATIYPSIYVFPSPKLVIYIYIIYFRIITIALLPTDDLIYIYIGVAVGGGWQGLVAYINLTCYYIIGLPVGFLLGYKAKLGVQVMSYSSVTSKKKKKNNEKKHFSIFFPLIFVSSWSQGIWMGMIIGTSLQTVVLCFIIWKTNWNDEVTTKETKTKPLLFF